MSEAAVNTRELGEKIVTVLKTIYDPEIPVDIYELGLIYDVFVNEDKDVKILMTLTSPDWAMTLKALKMRIITIEHFLNLKYYFLLFIVSIM